MIPIQLTVFFMIVYVLESLTIILQSGLLVAVLGREWVQVKRLSAVDMILTSLGICHFCLQWASMLNNFYSYFNPNYVFWYLSIAWDFLNTLSFWLTSLLAVVYCVKISSFTHPIFLWLRWRILRLVPRLLLGSLLLSCVTLICSAVRNHIKIKMISMEHFPRNNTMIERLKMLLQKFTLSQPTVVMIIPFLLFLASTILLMASLSQHLGQMQHHKAGHSNSSMKAHSTALRSLAIFLIFFTSYFLTIVISFVSILYDKSSWYWVWEAVIYAIVSVQSTLLMLSSPMLKKVLKLRCWVLETA
ncbi:taste receptor type 2 member 16 [Diceros bicornis minor]|uniref:taste receptor type 2 member 16 n=1 Tax=Diceros bicornis minor TaxID=77932 RepID=UPI0026EDAF2D|nr:taste receptor type 2 member 16 [Diceros bicornis minor]